MQVLLKTLQKLIEKNDVPEMRQAVACAIWPFAVGGQLKQYSRPVELNSREFIVKVRDARWKREFEHNAAQIVYKLNAAAGRSIVGRIKFVVDATAFSDLQTASPELGGTAAKAIDPKILRAAANIADVELRNNFIAAASGCMNRTLLK